MICVRHWHSAKEKTVIDKFDGQFCKDKKKIGKKGKNIVFGF